MNTNLRKKTKYDLQKSFLNLMNNAVFGKNYRKCKKKKEILNLSQQSKKETIWYQNEIIILQDFS